MPHQSRPLTRAVAKSKVLMVDNPSVSSIRGKMAPVALKGQQEQIFPEPPLKTEPAGAGLRFCNARARQLPLHKRAKGCGAMVFAATKTPGWAGK